MDNYGLQLYEIQDWTEILFATKIIQNNSHNTKQVVLYYCYEVVIYVIDNKSY